MFRCSYTDDLRVMAQQIDETNKEAGKGVRFSVRKAFNQLDVTVESAYGVVDSLLNYIQGAVSVQSITKMTGIFVNRNYILLDVCLIHTCS